MEQGWLKGLARPGAAEAGVAQRRRTRGLWRHPVPNAIAALSKIICGSAA